jgi:hypothetical protein
MNLPINNKNLLNEQALLGKAKFTKYFVSYMPKSFEYFVIAD